MKKTRIIILWIFIVCAVFFLFTLVKKENSISRKILADSDQLPVTGQAVYYMKKQDESIIVFNIDNSIYEYTDIELEFLPEEVLEQLNQGITFYNQEELYEFLETYSS